MGDVHDEVHEDGGVGAPPGGRQVGFDLDQRGSNREGGGW